MILKITMAAKVARRELEQISRVLHDHPFQNFESEIRRAMERETISEIVAIAPPCVMISPGKGVCAFDIATTILI